MNTLNSLTLWFFGIKGEPIKLTRDQRRIFNKEARAGFFRSPLHVVGFLGLQMVPVGYGVLAAILCIWFFDFGPSADLYTELALLPVIPMILVATVLGLRLFYPGFPR